MNNKLFGNFLVVGVTFLFLGLAVQPIASINNAKIEEVKSNDNVNDIYGEEDCNCEDLGNQNLDRDNRLLDEVELKVKNIMLNFGNIPDLKLKCNELLTIIDTSGNDGPICKLLSELFIRIFFIWDYFCEKEYEFNEMGRYVLADICLRIHSSIRATILLPIFFIGLSLNCSGAVGDP